MGRMYSTRGIEDECIQGLGGKTRKKETTRKTYVCARIILKWILEK
jgi:hypothetical protein